MSESVPAELLSLLEVPAQRSPAALRLCRRVPEAQAWLALRLEDPLERALAGLGPPPAEADSERALLSGMAALDQGLPLDAAACLSLEQRWQGDLRWWVPAARLAIAADAGRLRRCRASLSEQELPYVFPGDLHPLQVELLAGGEQVLAAQHVDWVRKLSEWIADALVLEGRALGLWYWPVLGLLDGRRLIKGLESLPRARRLAPGALGLAAASLLRLGHPSSALEPALQPLDRLLLALARAGDRPRGGPTG